MNRSRNFAAFALSAVCALTSAACFAQDANSELQARYDRMVNMLTLQKPSNKPLVDFEFRLIDARYIGKSGSVETGQVKLYLPKGVSKPVPLVYVPHYETTENSDDTRAYLAKGWAVASPVFVVKYNGTLTDDDLVFNNAALYTLRGLNEIDASRIALDGGSAGGYMTLMLAALQGGVCAAVANSPITNVYFNFQHYFRAAEALNASKGAELSDRLAKRAEQASDAERPTLTIRVMMETLPMPVIGMISATFDPLLENFPNAEDYARWEALSPVALADAFSSSLVVTHYTSDVLVPIDQISREYTHEQEGETIPEGFSTRLPKDFPGKLGRSLQEELPADKTVVNFSKLGGSDSSCVLAFDLDKPFNLDIYDDGPTQNYGGHSSSTYKNTIDKVPYFEAAFERTAAQTEFASSGKIRLLLRRYCGKSAQLPVREGVDDSVYGSLTVYRAEIVDEFARWNNDWSADTLAREVDDAIEGADESEREELRGAWDAIRERLR